MLAKFVDFVSVALKSNLEIFLNPGNKAIFLRKIYSSLHTEKIVGELFSLIYAKLLG